MKIIELKNVNKSFSSHIIFKDLNFSIEEGTSIGIIGQNGSGKSVLFKMMAGLYKPDSGQVFVRGKELGKDIDFPEDMGILIDEPGYVDYLTGYQNLKNLADIRGVIGDEEIKRTMNFLRLDPDDKTLAKNYSLGMKQKLGLSQAIMENQSIVILDEPFNALDCQTYEDIKEVIGEIKEEGKTLIMTSHNNMDIRDMCDELYFVQNYGLVPFTKEIEEKYFSRN